MLPPNNTTRKVAHVYFVTDGTGAVKIGYTGRLTTRLQSLQAECSGEVRLLHKIPANSIAAAAEIEGLLHRELHHRRVRGEWFALTAADLARAISPPEGDPLDRIKAIAETDVISAPEAAAILRVPLTRLRILLREGLLRSGPPFSRGEVESLAAEMAHPAQIGA